MRPADLPPVSRWADRPHGTRLRYLAGCKCVQCRAANSRYETHRLRERAKGRGNGIVPAAPARAHVAALGAKGMGYKRVAAAARVAVSVVALISSGRKTHIRQQTERRILGVRWQPALGARLDAGPTWVLLRELIAAGYPKVRLARWMGQRGPGLQVSRRQVSVRTALKVRALHRRLLAESDDAGPALIHSLSAPDQRGISHNAHPTGAPIS